MAAAAALTAAGLFAAAVGRAGGRHPAAAGRWSTVPSGNVTGVHDPSGVVVGDDGTPLVFCTSHSDNGVINVHAATNASLREWRWAGFAFAASELPPWVAVKVPANRNGQGVWAPDVWRGSGGTWHMFYSVSSFGSRQSCVGHASAPTLTARGAAWAQHGPVVCTGQPGAPDDGGFNAIDPHVLEAPGGRLLMTVGSFFSGIVLVDLGNVTGGVTTLGGAAAPSPTSLAAGAAVAVDAAFAVPLAKRADPSVDDSIEASWMLRDSGWYWLYVNWGLCCRGVQSTYNVRVGRSAAPEGPFVDRTGTRMLDGGGTLVQASQGRVVGPGQVGIAFRDVNSDVNGGVVVSEHFYDGDNDGMPTLALHSLRYDDGGWPVFAPLDDGADAGATIEGAAARRSKEHYRLANKESTATSAPILPPTNPPPSTPSSHSGGSFLTLSHTVVDTVALNYAVESRIYREDPTSMFVTLRGGGITRIDITDAANPRIPPNGHVNVFNATASYDTRKPRRGGLDRGIVDAGAVPPSTPSASTPPSVTPPPPPPIGPCEGQDRLGDVLAVATLGGVGESGVVLLNVSAAAPWPPRAPLGRVRLSLPGALHLKLYRAPSGRTYAIVTLGLSPAPTRAGVAAVDVTDPTRPVEVAAVQTACACAEGVLVVGDAAFVGSYCSSAVQMVSLAELPDRLALGESAQRPYYENMVSAVYNSSYQGYAAARGDVARNGVDPSASPSASRHNQLLFAASYADPGGLVVFNSSSAAPSPLLLPPYLHSTRESKPAASVSNATASVGPALPVEVGRLVTNATARSNRVHLHPSGVAVLALEKGHGDSSPRGGVAAVDVRDPTAPVLLDAVRTPNNASRTYCAATATAAAANVVFAFGATSRSLWVYTFPLRWRELRGGGGGGIIGAKEQSALP